MRIEMGVTVQDEVTGFKGIVTGRVEYITGCIQLLVQPKSKSGTEVIESKWFDEDRLEVANGKKIVLPSRLQDGCDKPAPVR